MPIGLDKKEFMLGAIDNTIVDGNRQYTIKASVYIPSCSCSANSNSTGVTTSQIMVIDDDTPSLKLTAKNSSIQEGKKNTITISLNTENPDGTKVNLSSDFDDVLVYNHDVYIPAKEKSVDVVIKAKEECVSNGNQIIVFTAKASGYSVGTCWMNLTDLTLPDAIISDLSVSPSEVKIGKVLTANVVVKNVGKAKLPSTTQINLYLSDSSKILAHLYLQDSLAVGESVVLTKNIMVPENAGSFYVFACANENQKFQELNYTNNRSVNVPIIIKPAFSVNANTDKERYQQGETVTIYGTATGENVANIDLEVYVINGNLRQTIAAKTDADGKYTVEFLPYANQSGHFDVGACFPNEGVKASMTSFEIYGITLSHKVKRNESITVNTVTPKEFVITNPCNIPLTNLNFYAESLDDDCSIEFECPTEIAGNATVSVYANMKGLSASEGDNYKMFNVCVNSAEGAKASVPVYYYTFSQESKIVANEKSVNATMIKGQSRDYPITITNKGKGATGKIEVLLPQEATWLSLATAKEMPSLELGDSAIIILRFITTDDIQLNVPNTAKIAINCESGDALLLPITVEPVSEVKGTLVIDACDEITYNTAEATHLAGAHVKISHPTLGTLFAEGDTDSNGIFMVELNEGYYSVSVTADNHDQYRNNLLVNPSRETRQVVNLSINGISISWDVVETEVEDEYKIVTNVQYETHLPKPVVVISGPENLDGDNMAEGEQKLVYFTLTNKGLITALNTDFQLTEASPEWSMEALAYRQPFDLKPEESVTIPVLVTRKSVEASPTRRANYMNTCMAEAEAEYMHMCGRDLRTNRSAWRMAMKHCARSAILTALTRGLGIEGGLGGPVRNTGGYNPNYNGGYVNSSQTICNPEVARRLEVLESSALGRIPILGDFFSAEDIALDAVTDERSLLQGISGWYGEKLVNIGITGIGAALDNGLVFEIGNDVIEIPQVNHASDFLGNSWNVVNEIIFLRDLDGDGNQQSANNVIRKSRRANTVYDWMTKFDDDLRKAADYLYYKKKVYQEIFGDSVWYKEVAIGTSSFWHNIKALANNGETPNVENVLVKPENVTTEQVKKLLDRLNSSFDSGKENRINLEILRSYYSKIEEIDNEAKEKGYDSEIDFIIDAYKNYKDQLDVKSTSTCASISLRIEQKMIMTRQAFRGTLTVYNGHVDTAMKDVKLKLLVTDENGQIAGTREFQISPESLKGFKGELTFEDGWELASETTGTATILFIPTKYAAETSVKTYTFGGHLAYVDPYTDLEVTRELLPVTLTVNPSPNLEMNYFMQRNVFGDDPLTKDIVEPKVPAEFSLLINNIGYGDATNVKMVTNQPEIVDNEKGLLINFEILSSQLNGGEKTLALGQSVATDFGTIPAGKTSYAQWWFTSSLLGHFTEYDVNATHMTSYGNPDLSLLDNVNIHELIHTLTIPKSESMRGFLVNEEKDNKDLPDMLYMTDGTIKAVAQASATLTDKGNNIYTLTTEPAAAGWNYGNLVDPTNGHKVLASITRQSDGQTIPLANFWQTDRTLRDNKDPLYEYRLHFADEMSATGETYTLAFEDKPMTILAVDTIVSDKIKEGVIASDVERVTVTFNKAVAASTFTTEDIELLCGGEKVDVSNVEIVKIDEKNFELNLKPAIMVDGYYVLTVQAATIKDTESYTGEYGKQISWTQMIQQEVKLEYDIPEGWSWISSSISSGSITDAKTFVEPVKDKMDRLVGIEKELTNDPSYGLVGNLTTILPVDGYKLHVNSPVQFDYSGIAGEPTSNVINLHGGWNWIGFLPIKAMSVEEAMKNHTPAENDLLKNLDAFATYSDGAWTGTLMEMKPGEGYMYFSTQDASFIYPKAYVSSSAPIVPTSLSRAIEVNVPWQYDTHKYADNSALVGKLFVDNEYDAEGNYVVGAFCDDECRGVGVNIGGLVYMVIHGTIGEKNTITFRAYNCETGSERSILENFVFEGQNLGAVKSPAYLHAGNYTRISALEAGFTIAPRPIKNKLYIVGNTDVIKSVQILATNGKTVLKNEGYDQSGIDVGVLLPAMYIIAIETNDGKICYDKVFKINN